MLNSLSSLLAIFLMIVPLFISYISFPMKELTELVLSNILTADSFAKRIVPFLFRAIIPSLSDSKILSLTRYIADIVFGSNPSRLFLILLEIQAEIISSTTITTNVIIE